MDIPSYLMGAIKGAHDAGIKYVVVQELPTTGEEGIIYLVPKSTSKTNNIYDEYMYISNNWELIGDTEADLSNYLAKNNTTAFTPSGDYNPATKKYVDDKVSDATIQYSTMPTASSSNTGQIIQYTGTTTNDYINGYFYECVEDNNTYSWENLNVQDAGGLPSDLAKIYLCTSTVGGSSGELFDVCKKVYDDYKNGIKSAMLMIFAYAYDGSEINKNGLYYYNYDSMWNSHELKRMGRTYKKQEYNSYSSSFEESGLVTLTISNDELTSVAFQTGSGSNYSSYLETSIDYSTPYTPQYAGSPATKKYVDDSISSAITDALTGSY